MLGDIIYALAVFLSSFLFAAFLTPFSTSPAVFIIVLITPAVIAILVTSNKMVNCLDTLYKVPPITTEYTLNFLENGIFFRIFTSFNHLITIATSYTFSFSISLSSFSIKYSSFTHLDTSFNRS